MANNLSTETINTLLEKFLRANLEIEEARRLEGHTLDPDELALKHEVLGSLYHDAGDALERNDWDVVSHYVDDLLAEAGLTVAHGSPDYIRLCRGVLTMQRKFFQVELRGGGGVRLSPRPPWPPRTAPRCRRRPRRS